MAYRAIPATLLCLCVGLPAAAADLAFSLGGEVEYDDNVFRRDDDEEEDVLFRLRPGVSLYEEREGDLRYRLRYELPLEFAVENNDELQDEDHIADGTFTYHASDRVEVFGSDRFGYLRSTLRRVRVDTGATVTDVPEIDERRDRVTQNDATLGALYRFSPRLVGRVVGSTGYFDPTRDDRARVFSIGGTADTIYTLTARHQVGGGVAYAYQDFSDRTSIEGSQTNVYNVFGSWRWLIDPTLSLDVRAGPSYLETRQEDSQIVRTAPTVPSVVLGEPTNVVGFFRKDGSQIDAEDPDAIAPSGSLLVPTLDVIGGTGTNCTIIDGRPVAAGCVPNIVLTVANDPAEYFNVLSSQTTVSNFDGGDRDSRWTVFAEAVVTKHWSPTLATALSYSRQQGNASGLGGSVIVDAVSLSNTWDFWERWQLALRGDWTRRESAFDIQQSYDVVDGTFPAGSVFLAARTGAAFNSPTGAEIETNRWGVAGRVTHQLFRRTLVYVQVRYDEQESDSRSLARTSDFENLLATFGVRHTFEPITLW